MRRRMRLVGPTTDSPPLANGQAKNSFRETRSPYLCVSTLCYLDSKRRTDKCSLFLVMTRGKARKKSSARSTKDERGRSASFFFLPNAKSDELLRVDSRSLRRRLRRQTRCFHFFFHHFTCFFSLSARLAKGSELSHAPACPALAGFRSLLCFCTCRERRDGGKQRQQR